MREEDICQERCLTCSDNISFLEKRVIFFLFMKIEFQKYNTYRQYIATQLHILVSKDARRFVKPHTLSRFWMQRANIDPGSYINVERYSQLYPFVSCDFVTYIII